MDAVDECPNNFGMPASREKVLVIVEELVSSRPPHAHICVTSRPEVDIQVILGALASHQVSLHDEYGQQKDIINYVKSVIESDPRMRKWREEEKELVIETLARKADGMYGISTVTWYHDAYSKTQVSLGFLSARYSATQFPGEHSACPG